MTTGMDTALTRRARRRLRHTVTVRPFCALLLGSLLGCASTEPPRPVSSFARMVAPCDDADDSLIAFVRRSRWWEVRDPHHLFVVRPDGSRERQFTSFHDASEPVWSPDGRSIAFVLREQLDHGSHSAGTLARVWIIDRSGSPLRVMNTNPARTPSWSPDGKMIAYQIDHGPHSQEIGIVATDHGRLPPTVERVSDYRDGTSDFGSWSPDAQSIVYAMRAYEHRRSGVYRHTLRSADAVRIAAPLPATRLAWSPVEDLIAWVRMVDNHLYVMRPDGRMLRRLTDGSGEHGDYGPPVWSPDGIRLAVTIKGVLYVIDANGGGLTRLTEAALRQAPSWSPDGCRLVFAASSGPQRSGSVADRSAPTDLFVINADGTGLRKLTDTPDEHEWAPAWSPRLETAAKAARR
jgi:Tol biopolymer transport system component